MKTTQPCYHCIENIGDVNPLDYGGAFVCVDKLNVYSPILLILDTYPDHIEFTHRLYEITLDRCFLVKKNNEIVGIGSNPYHTDYCEWFGNLANLESIADTFGRGGYDSLLRGFITSDPIERAFSYKLLTNYHGLHEFDQDPRDLTEDKAKLFCDKMFEQMQETKHWWEGYFRKEVS